MYCMAFGGSGMILLEAHPTMIHEVHTRYTCVLVEGEGRRCAVAICVDGGVAVQVLPGMHLSFYSYKVYTYVCVCIHNMLAASPPPLHRKRFQGKGQCVLIGTVYSCSETCVIKMDSGAG